MKNTYNVKKIFGENTFYLNDRVEVKNLSEGAKLYGGATEINNKIYSNINESEELKTNDDNIFGILVPTTINVNTTVDNKKYVKEIEDTLKDFGKLTSKIDSKGSWYSDTEGIVIEENTIIKFFSNGNIFDLQLLKYLGEKLKKDMKQEAITIILNNGIAII